MKRTLEEVAEHLRIGKRYGKKCSLLIGAGCSRSAGIPTAKEFVAKIEANWAHAFNRAKEKSYPYCMAELLPAEQRNLIGEYVDSAKINWAHICIAQLIEAGYVDRVLTTNFDDLVIRACALLGKFPSVYDLAILKLEKRSEIPGPAIFYLHGQRSGFVLMNTKKEVEDHFKKLEPAFDKATEGRMWIVVGYSGENDPVFDHLARIERYENGLFWVGYKEEEPGQHLNRDILKEEKSGFFVSGYDADGFFIKLTRALDIFPPLFVTKPFSYLDGLFGNISLIEELDGKTNWDVTSQTREKLKDAAKQFEKDPSEEIDLGVKMIREDKDSLHQHLESLLLAGNYAEVLKYGSLIPEQGGDLLPYYVAWALLMQGNKLAEKLLTDSSEVSSGELEDILKQYQKALAIKPDMHEALYNWGNALKAYAGRVPLEKAEPLYSQAWKKYAAALAIKPDMHEALNNWGSALAAYAGRVPLEKAEPLYGQAGEKYAAALAIKPDMHETLNNWGVALAGYAGRVPLEKAEPLYGQAWKKYAAALAIKPDMHEALNNWGVALAAYAGRVPLEKAEPLYGQAGEKYMAALAIKPDKHEALNNWGVAFLSQGKRAKEAAKSALFQKAQAKLLAAEKIESGTGSYNLACLFALQGDEVQCKNYLDEAKVIGKLPIKENIQADEDLDRIKNCEWFYQFLKTL